jgi:hypothetical protein
MVSKYEHRYKDEDPRRRARLVLASILAAVAVPLMAVAVSAMTPKPYVGSGGVDISASGRHFDTPFAQMYRASKSLPVESWGPAF